MRPVIVWLLAACGRVGFDAAPHRADAAACVPATGHDEDGDGVADDCDVCPHIPGPQVDGDGDRVGDACDPEPAAPRQRIVLFDPFTSDDGWMPVSTVTQLADSVQLGGVGQQGSLRRALVPTTDLLILGASTRGAGAGQHLLAVIFKELADPKAFYCELFDGGATTKLLFTYTLDGITYMHPGDAPTDRLANGSGELAFFIDPTDAKCASTWNGPIASASAVRPQDIDAMVLGLYAENVEAELRYFVQIRTEP